MSVSGSLADIPGAPSDVRFDRYPKADILSDRRQVRYVP
jgi:hypothetical protein